MWTEGRDAIVECIVTVMLKLSERRMKPMFLHIVDWSIKSNRKLFLYSLVISLSDKLKSIFTPFYEYILSHLTEDMKQFAEGGGGDGQGSGRDGTQGGRSSSKRQRTQQQQQQQQTTKSKNDTLLEYERIEMATTCLLNCFTFDNAATTANVKDYGAFLVILMFFCNVVSFLFFWCFFLLTFCCVCVCVCFFLSFLFPSFFLPFSFLFPSFPFLFFSSSLQSHF